jgi:hypothetical protein
VGVGVTVEKGKSEVVACGTAEVLVVDKRTLVMQFLSLSIVLFRKCRGEATNRVVVQIASEGKLDRRSGCGRA